MADPAKSRSGGYHFVLSFGGLVLVVAALYWAQKILVPLALAVLLAFILAPFVAKLQRLGLSRVLAVIVAVTIAFALIGVLLWSVASQLRHLLDEIPRHREEIEAKLRQLPGNQEGPVSKFVEMVRDISDKLRVKPPESVDGKTPQPVVVVNDGSSMVTWVASAVGTLLEFLLGAFFVVILLVFILAHREDLRNRLFQAVGRGQVALLSQATDTATQRISRYLRMQLAINFGTGVLWCICLFLMPNGEGGRGVPYPLLWGVLLAALRFVPYVGTWVAMVFPVLLSMALSPVGHPWLQPVLLTCVFLGLELITANVIEPLVFGHNSGVSPVALLIAAVFWAWLWGPVGLVLSTPITVCLVVMGKYVPQLSLLNILFGSDPPADTETSYYQRLLVHDEDEATEIVQTHLEKNEPTSVYDDLLVPALVLTRRDAERRRWPPATRSSSSKSRGESSTRRWRRKYTPRPPLTPTRTGAWSSSAVRRAGHLTSWPCTCSISFWPRRIAGRTCCRPTRSRRR